MAEETIGHGGPRADAEVTFFVSPRGNDAWSGTLAVPNTAGTDGPFATLARARDAVRELKAQQPAGPVTVLVRGDKYYLDRTLILGPQDAGTRESPVTYRAYPGETPVLSGGRISGYSCNAIRGGMRFAGWEGEGSLWGLTCDPPIHVPGESR